MTFTRNLVAIIALVFVSAQSAKAEILSDSNMSRISTGFSLNMSDVRVESNQTESTISSQPQTGYGLSVHYDWDITSQLSVGIGLSAESMVLRTQSSVANGRFIAEFEHQAYYVGLPIGARYYPSRGHSFYIPFAVTPKLKVSPDSERIVKCTGLCEGGARMVESVVFAEAGLGWSFAHWDIQFAYSQGLKDQFKGEATDYRVRSLELAAIYRFF